MSLVGNGLVRPAAWAKPRDECRSAADRDLIFRPVVEEVVADARRGLRAVGRLRREVDVDEAAPVFGEFLVADDPTEPPDGRLIDGSSRGSGCWLRIGGDQVQARLDGVLLGEGFDETQGREDAQLHGSRRSERRSDMSSAQQLTMPSRSPSLPRWVNSSPICSGHRVFIR